MNSELIQKIAGQLIDGSPNFQEAVENAAVLIACVVGSGNPPANGAPRRIEAWCRTGKEQINFRVVVEEIRPGGIT